MGTHQVNLDEEVLKSTLRRTSEDRDAEGTAALDVLGRSNLIDRAEVWC
jgi:hypothetical protein